MPLLRPQQVESYFVLEARATSANKSVRLSQQKPSPRCCQPLLAPPLLQSPPTLTLPLLANTFLHPRLLRRKFGPVVLQLMSCLVSPLDVLFLLLLLVDVYTYIIATLLVERWRVCGKSNLDGFPKQRLRCLVSRICLLLSLPPSISFGPLLYVQHLLIAMPLPDNCICFFCR
jgi:hypothetical protein